MVKEKNVTIQLRAIRFSLIVTAFWLFIGGVTTAAVYGSSLVINQIPSLFVVQALTGFLLIAYFCVMFGIATECIKNWTEIWYTNYGDKND